MKGHDLSLSHYTGWILLVVSLAGCTFALSAAVAARLLLRRQPLPLQCAFPAITLLKPLHGAECGLESALASFLKQDYPGQIQVVFGLRYTGDPAIGVVESLKRRFPNRDIEVVVDPAMHGTNRKISNVLNMMKVAKHEYLVLTDSDITAPRDYLSTIAAEAARPGVGIVSCLYAGKGSGNSWSRLSAMGLSYHFLPNAALGIALGVERPCFGSTIGLSRKTLDTIGGFEAFTEHFVDDYEIGRAAREAGFAIAYPATVVQHACDNASFAGLVSQELRWARAVRVVNPVGHLASFVTYPLALALLGAALLGFSQTASLIVLGVLAARILLKLQIDSLVGTRTGSLLWLPLRDLLSFAIFLGSMVGNAVEWRGERLRVEKSGLMSQIQG
jgi:ceramide glucosyltransferase